jgi:hypothetical protein
MTIPDDTPRCGDFGGIRRGEINKETGERSGAGDTCAKPAGAGTSHPGTGRCSWHDVPPLRRKAEAELALAETRQGLAQLGDAPPLHDIADAYGELLSVAGKLRALVAALEAKVAELEEVGVNHPVRGPVVKSELNAYVMVVRLLIDTIGRIGRLNVEERLTRISEHQAALLERVLLRTLAEICPTPEEHEQGRRVMAKHLGEVRALDATNGDTTKEKERVE